MTTDRPTPETDEYIGEGQDDCMTEGEIAMCNFARRLERERDEAREQLAAERALADRLVGDLDDLWYNYSLTGVAYEVIESARTAWEEARK